MKDKLFYKIVRPFINVLFKILYRPKYIGLENIPKKGRIILAGNHTHNFDCILLISSTKRQIHFLAKDSLIKGWKKVIFNNMGIIPVNRSIKDHDALENGIKTLELDNVIGIFPEGTFNRTEDITLPFKFGAVKMAKETNSMIVPFTITGEFKLFRKSVKIHFLEPISIQNDLVKENEKLRKIVSNNLVKDREEL